MNCAVKKGFFTLRECLAPADATCTTCGRPCCEEHRREEACVECFYKSVEAGPGAADEAWIFSYRHRFYQDTGYDAHDLRGFAVEGHGEGEDEDADPDIGDS